MAAEAAVTGDYNKVVLALTTNPLTLSDKVAKEIVNEMMQTYKEYLLNFS